MTPHSLKEEPIVRVTIGCTPLVHMKTARAVFMSVCLRRHRLIAGQHDPGQPFLGWTQRNFYSHRINTLKQ
jgi:hypothetical protein